ncbi:MAG: YvcK family protein [Turicibacter sp.]|nr:YvcK family protein [Turicibacter sp.]MBQ1787199.1 YvcK family protein [Turicibacter sp.]MEE1237566.1 YvcK family protein [Turicibacter sp.]
MGEYDLKVVVIGGGTGLSTILRGLKRYPIDITAIVTVADDGGSSGSLRTDFDVPPPGDIRNVLVALSEVEPLVQELFQYRFTGETDLAGHPTGNLLIAAMTNITGDFSSAIQKLSEVLKVRGKVLPVCNTPLCLCAEYDDGTIIQGESLIPTIDKKIKRVYYSKEGAKALSEAVEAIMEADLVLLGPGSLYTSIIPNLLLGEISEALSKTSAECVYCCNIMTQPGETTGYSASEHIKAIHQHAGYSFIDKIIVNDDEINSKVYERYREQHSDIVEIDEKKLSQMNIKIIKSRLVSYNNVGEVRHNAKKVAATIFSLLLDIEEQREG